MGSRDNFEDGKGNDDRAQLGRNIFCSLFAGTIGVGASLIMGGVPNSMILLGGGATGVGRFIEQRSAGREANYLEVGIASVSFMVGAGMGRYFS